MSQYKEDSMGGIVGFIDKEGLSGTCSEDETIECKKCEFYKKFKGKEKANFSYCTWKGEIKENKR